MGGLQIQRASGNIYPCRFVKQDTSNPGQVAQAGAGDIIAGVAHDGTDLAPTPLNTNGYAAQAGENVCVYGPNQTCRIELAATVTTERRLKSDSNGKGTPVTGGANSYENWGAWALEPGSAGDKVKCLVVGPMTVAHPGSLSGFA